MIMITNIHFIEVSHQQDVEHFSVLTNFAASKPKLYTILLLSNLYEMDIFEYLQLQLYVTYGVLTGCVIIILILITVIFAKLRKLSEARREPNRLESEFCYSNPAIVPGEELSRRGFSIYRAYDNPAVKNNIKNNNYVISRESQARF